MRADAFTIELNRRSLNWLWLREDLLQKHWRGTSRGVRPLQDNEELGAPIQEEVRRRKVREGRDSGVARLLPGVQRQ